MKDPEMRQLRYFVAVAEELNFSRAAARLGIAQPPLSRAIRELERQLGVQLFERSRRHVALTRAGIILLEDARNLLDAVAAAAHRARNAGRESPVLRIALKADYDAGLLPDLLDAYRSTDDALPVDLVLGGRGDQVLALRTGRADVALIPTPFDDSGFDLEPLVTEERVVALAANDPLAARTRLRLIDLAGRVQPDGSPADHGVTAELFAAAGLQSGPAPMGPEDTAGSKDQPLDLAKIFHLVELGAIVWFPPLSVAQRHPRRHVAYLPVVDLPATTFTLAWPTAPRSRAVADFVRAATTVVRNAGQREREVADRDMS
ncbi:LysR family transcriptional regulator [Amycolatopsis sp. NBC_01480]|uniref:LysR family transcriptional regulator n=1 Tax=Amycolatopsis sp. NBC_01480 TaxID=2903562 RepID=UPI002E2BCCCB|nr:LysR family transcriptional regulator [Amycolatopsis sp. NBC_01480]